MAISINEGRVTISKPPGGDPTGVYISPWVDGVKDSAGNWTLPEYPSEVKGLEWDDPKNKPWTPGQFEMGVDNVGMNENNQVSHWGGQKMWEGEKPPADWQASLRKASSNVKALLKVPHLPGQPVKEMFARMKALDPRPFEDKYFEEIHRDLPASWMSMLRRVQWAEGFGVHSEDAPAEWAGREEELLPAAYTTPRPDTVTVSVGIAGYDPAAAAPLDDLGDIEYDYLEFLYARDQEGKLIQIVPYENTGINPTVFGTFSFVPPVGTTSITPFACFKLRGVWKGMTIEWDETIGSEDMKWFSEMSPELRLMLADKDKLTGRNQRKVEEIRYAKSKKPEPVLWPENSWEGNAAKARLWDEKKQIK